MKKESYLKILLMIGVIILFLLPQIIGSGRLIDPVTEIEASNVLNEYWVNESGDTMTGNLDLGNNNITNIWYTYSEDFYVGNYIQEQGDSGTFIQFPGDRHIHIWSGGYPVAEFIGGTPKGYLLLGDGTEEVDLIVYGSTNQELLHVDSVLDSVNISGSVNVVGNANFTGNITAENVFTHSYMFIHTNKTQPVTGAGVWMNITFDEEGADLNRGITHTYNDATNYTFTIIEDGIYELFGHYSVQDSAVTPSSHIVFRFTKNNIEIPGSIWERDLDKKDWDTIGSISVFTECSAGDELIFQFTSDQTTVSLESDATYGTHKDTATMKIKRIA